MTIFEPFHLHYDINPKDGAFEVIELATGEVIAQVPNVLTLRKLVIDLEIAFRTKFIRTLQKEIDLLSVA